MSSPAQPSIATRILDAIFGKRLTGIEAERALAARPPRWVNWVFNGLFVGWVCVFAIWGLRSLGWFPAAFREGGGPSLFWVSVIGAVMSLLREEVSKRYRRRAEREMKLVRTSPSQ